MDETIEVHGDLIAEMELDKYSQEKNTSKENLKLKLQNFKVEKEIPTNTVYNY